MAAKLREYADLLIQQGEGGFCSRAYHQAADVIDDLSRPVDNILSREHRAEGQLESLEDLEYAPHFGDLALKRIGERRKPMRALPLAERLGRPAVILVGQRIAPSVSLLLAVDRMYHRRAGGDAPPRIEPRGATREVKVAPDHAHAPGWLAFYGTLFEHPPAT